ncbi:MAG: hypothetical protein COT74_00815 [Bdellovibrionales bacterium CG10_big_fil_rev_8_21_14_0_10_45_34]|nr:MAG: hypothetical protein COT74_00815 [Bdellovibrionales bacterium CG10_big_fil_rev_8_21_14_0_10_45_34]
MSKRPTLLSKTKIMRGFRCLKSIYLTVHHPELETPVTPEQQAVFSQGTRVGEEARKRFPGGTLVANEPWDFTGSLNQTKQLLAEQCTTIYEAAFTFDGCYARADIIQFSPATGKWTIFEVKSSTSVKREHFFDVGLQAWIMKNSGLPIEKICILHMNSSCKYPKLDDLFKSEDVTEKVQAIGRDIPIKVRATLQVIKLDKMPEADIGPHCTAPNDCGFKDFCWKEKNIPKISVLNLPQIKSRKWDLYSQGIVPLDDERLDDLTTLQRRIVKVFKSNERFFNSRGIKEALSSWVFPITFLDFETIAPAIPRYDKTSPYQQVPFQFSAHIWPSPQSKPTHKEYLHTEKTDPRPQLIPKLIDACGNTGSIVAYYSQFESNRISELAKYSATHKIELNSLLPRIVDPLPVIRNNIYDNAFECSFSLKKVAPAILGQHHSYSGMEVANGTEAQMAFEEIISCDTLSERKEELILASLEYCKKDTLVMVELVQWLFNKTGLLSDD